VKEQVSGFRAQVSGVRFQLVRAEARIDGLAEANGYEMAARDGKTEMGRGASHV